MPGVSREQINEAKEVDLLTYMQRYEPEALTKSGRNEYKLKEHESLKISNGKWNWFSAGIGGRTALDFLVKVRGMNFVDAVRTLVSPEAQDIRGSPNRSIQEKEKAVEEKEPLLLPEKNTVATRAIRYLKDVRGIDADILTMCLSKRILYEGIYRAETGEKAPMLVFLGKDEGGTAKYASLRSIDGDDYKGNARGSDIKHGFTFKSDFSFSRYLVVTESAIDALSVASIVKQNAGREREWEDYSYLSLGGVSPKAGLHYLKNNPGIEKVVLCLDNDEAGRRGSKKFREAVAADAELATRKLDIREKPPKMKDYNEDLKMRRISVSRCEAGITRNVATR
jgi:hypothetical protein